MKENYNQTNLIEKLSMGIKMLNIPNIVTEEEEKQFFELIASNIKRIRKEKNLSQLEVALCIGQKAQAFMPIWKIMLMESILISHIFLDSLNSLIPLLKHFLV